MTAHWIVSIAPIVFIAVCVVWLVDRQVQRDAQRTVRDAEAETWGDEDDHWRDGAQRPRAVVLSRLWT